MSSSTNPVRGVTTENYVSLAKAFMASNGGAGFVIALEPVQHGSTHYPATPRQWGAWMSYWRQIGKRRAKGTEARGHATVPTEWPHQFDTAATVQGDHAAADAFEMHGGRTYRTNRQLRPRQKFTPYPKLWDALADEPDLLKALEAIETFDGITDISKTMAVEGIEAAKVKLRRIASMPNRERAA